MTETDWLTAFTTESPAEALYDELATVVQPRKLFLLGTAFLRRIFALLPGSWQTAVEVTEGYTVGLEGFGDLLGAWLEAEESTRTGFWFPPDYLPFSERRDGCCPSCDAIAAATLKRDTNYGVRQAIRSPDWLAAQSAELAIDRLRSTVKKKEQASVVQREQRAQFALYQDIVGEHRAPRSVASVALRQHREIVRLVRLIETELVCGAAEGTILADALEEVGCEQSDVLAHFRGGLPHGPGCWGLEWLTGRAVIALPYKDGQQACPGYRTRELWWRHSDSSTWLTGPLGITPTRKKVT